MCAWGPGLLAAASGWTDGDGHLKGSVLQRQGVQSPSFAANRAYDKGPTRGSRSRSHVYNPECSKGRPHQQTKAHRLRNEG